MRVSCQREWGWGTNTTITQTTRERQTVGAILRKSCELATPQVRAHLSTTLRRGLTTRTGQNRRQIAKIGSKRDF